MIPIHDLLSRIRWDPGLAAAEFEIGYWDRVARRIVRVPFRRIRFDSGTTSVFEAVEDDGTVHSVPLHRVRAVWRDGELIWQRPPPTAPAGAGH
jgi:uncharacterized protein (UPF0248 family)